MGKVLTTVGIYRPLVLVMFAAIVFITICYYCSKPRRKIFVSNAITNEMPNRIMCVRATIQQCRIYCTFFVLYPNGNTVSIFSQLVNTSWCRHIQRRIVFYLIFNLWWFLCFIDWSIVWCCFCFHYDNFEEEIFFLMWLKKNKQIIGFNWFKWFIHRNIYLCKVLRIKIKSAIQVN